MNVAKLYTCTVFFVFFLGVAVVGSDVHGFPSGSAQQQTISGKVLETMNSGGYTYLNIDDGQNKLWAAIPESKVDKGQDIVIGAGMPMENFESKTLNRTFESIIFSPGIVTEAQTGFHGGTAPAKKGAENDFAAALQAEGGAAPSDMAAAEIPQGSAGSAGAIVPSADVAVEKAEGENGYTIGEIFEKRKELDGKTVLVRGKVMKFSPMIMGKNWIHLQDGSGNPMLNSHDLVLTTMASPEKDSVILVEGTVHADRDFGAGYRYDVIIEDATVK